MSARTRKTRARLASLTNRRGPDDPDLIAARQDHYAAKIEELISSAPPLREKDAERIRALLSLSSNENAAGDAA